MSRRLAAAGTAVLLAVSLGACSAEPPLPTLQPQEAALPVSTPEQVDRVLAGVAEGLAVGDAALDAAQLGPRVVGPAAELRTAGYAVRRVLPTGGVIRPIGTERLADLVPAEQAWPRTVMTVTRVSADDAAAPVLSLLTQASPRDPYALTAYVSLLPGASVPAIEPVSTGVAVPALDAAGDLALAPTDVVARYADVLVNGAASAHAAAFADDAFRQRVLAEQDGERQAVTVTCPGCWSYTVAHTPRAGGLWALGTADGGAIVLGMMDSSRALTVAAQGSRLPLPGELGLLAGKQETTVSATFTSVELVAFVVPPAGSTDPVQVIGSERNLVGSTAG